MSEHVLNAKCDPHGRVVVSAQHGLHVSGWERDEISVAASGEQPPQLREEADHIVLTCKHDSRVRVPRHAQLEVPEVGGKAEVKALRGPLVVHKSGSNLTLRDLAGATLQVVQGNLEAEDVAGSLEIQAVYGNASLRGVSGPITIQDQVNGNLTLADCGEIQARALGNISLWAHPEPGQRTSLHAGGNLVCRLPAQASAALALASESRTITVDIGQGPAAIPGREHSLTLGTGQAELSLAAGGRLDLVSTEGIERTSPGAAGVAGLSEELAQQINRQMDQLGAQLNQQLSDLTEAADPQALPPDELDIILDQARATSQKAALLAQEKAQRAAQRAHDQLERKLEKARRKAQQKVKAAHKQANRSGRSWRVRGRRTPGSRSGAPASPVSDEERALILQMLEQGQINVEQADQLLSALEGKGG